MHDVLRPWLCLGHDETDGIKWGDNPAVMQPQGCRLGWLMLVLRYDTIAWALGLMITVSAYRIIFCYEYVQAVQVAMTVSLAR